MDHNNYHINNDKSVEGKLVLRRIFTCCMYAHINHLIEDNLFNVRNAMALIGSMISVHI